MKKLLLQFCLLLFLFVFCYRHAKAQNNTWAKQKATAWFHKGDWEHGLTITPDASINAQEFAVQYHADKNLWKKVLGFLNRKDLATLAPGAYPIAGDSAYATVSQYVPKDFDKTQWESHRKYIDVQYVIAGKEKIGVAKVSSATVTQPYNAGKDVAHYSAKGKYYVATPAEFFIFFPQEAHRPGIKTDDINSVKKLVIKVMVNK